MNLNIKTYQIKKSEIFFSYYEKKIKLKMQNSDRKQLDLILRKLEESGKVVIVVEKEHLEKALALNQQILGDGKSFVSDVFEDENQRLAITIKRHLHSKTVKNQEPLPKTRNIPNSKDVSMINKEPSIDTSVVNQHFPGPSNISNSKVTSVINQGASTYDSELLQPVLCKEEVSDPSENITTIKQENTTDINQESFPKSRNISNSENISVRNQESCPESSRLFQITFIKEEVLDPFDIVPTIQQDDTCFPDANKIMQPVWIKEEVLDPSENVPIIKQEVDCFPDSHIDYVLNTEIKVEPIEILDQSLETITPTLENITNVQLSSIPNQDKKFVDTKESLVTCSSSKTKETCASEILHSVIEVEPCQILDTNTELNSMKNSKEVTENPIKSSVSKDLKSAKPLKKIVFNSKILKKVVFKAKPLVKQIKTYSKKNPVKLIEQDSNTKSNDQNDSERNSSYEISPQKSVKNSSKDDISKSKEVSSRIIAQECERMQLDENKILESNKMSLKTVDQVSKKYSVTPFEKLDISKSNENHYESENTSFTSFENDEDPRPNAVYSKIEKDQDLAEVSKSNEMSVGNQLSSSMEDPETEKYIKGLRNPFDGKKIFV